MQSNFVQYSLTTDTPANTERSLRYPLPAASTKALNNPSPLMAACNSLSNLFRRLWAAVMTASMLLATPVQAQIEEIIVTTDFRTRTLMEAIGSIGVITADSLEQSQSYHLSEIISLVANVHFTSGSNRPRFFQIRGIGERSQFIDPINPSVGLIIDGIDFSGIGGAATLVDIQQLEVIRGPQGTRYGSNALGGLITIRSQAPTDQAEGRLSLSLGDISENEGLYDHWSLGAMVSGPLANAVKGRLAIEKNSSDGFVDNLFLGLDDTNNIDELSIKGQLRIDPSEQLSLGLVAMYIDADNGYDVFNLDNSYDTISDMPGKDAQEALAMALDLNYQLSDELELELTASSARSSIEYSYDEDWTYAGFDPLAYEAFDQYSREHWTQTADLRLLGSPTSYQWVFGTYIKRQSVQLERNETYLEQPFNSDYNSHYLAAYGQLDVPLGELFRVSYGLRLERFEGDYSDNANFATSPAETLWGGHISLETRLTERSTAYGRLSKGYKAGGANTAGLAIIDSMLPDAQLLINYNAETLINYELGLKGSSPSTHLSYQLAVFYYDRKDAQVKQSLVSTPCPCTLFTDYIDNAADASAIGLELELHWSVNEHLKTFASLGLLQAKFDHFLTFTHTDADIDNGIPFDLSGRQLPQSPPYQLNLGLDAQLAKHWTLWVTFELNGAHYLSSRHDVKAASYQLLDTSLQYEGHSWTASLWAKNLLNEDYVTRGFGSFPNDPRDGYSSQGPYYQKGDPREIAISLDWHF